MWKRIKVSLLQALRWIHSWVMSRRKPWCMTYKDSITSFCTYFSIEPMRQSVINTIYKINLFLLFSKWISKIFFVLWFLVEGRIPDFWKGQFIWILGKGVRSTSVTLNIKLELWRDLELCSNESFFCLFFFFRYKISLY